MVDFPLGLVQQARVELRTVWQTGVGWSFQSRSLDLAVFAVGTVVTRVKQMVVDPNSNLS